MRCSSVAIPVSVSGCEDEDDGDDVTELTFFVVAVLAQKLFPPFKPRK